MIYITHKDRLSRLSFLTLHSIFNKFGTNVIAINDDDKNNYAELFDEVTSHALFFYQKRKPLNFFYLFKLFVSKCFFSFIQ